MKKIITLLTVLLSFLSLASFAQLVQASIGLGSTSNSVALYLRPTATQTPAQISTLQFNLAISASITPIPTVTVASSAFTGVTWIVGAPYLEGGMRHYNIFTAASPLSINTTANVEFNAMEVRFSGGPVSTQDVSLVTLPDGGTTSPNYALFLVTGTLQSNGISLLYYARPGVSVTNTFSYDPNLVIPGVATSSATFTGVVLPVKLTNFGAIKKNNDGLLSWNLENQDIFADHFEIERSFNAADFTYVGRTDAISNATGTVSYNYTDRNVNALKSPVIYYRIKSMDKNGGVSFTEIRSIRVSDKLISASLYPNPAVSFTNLSYDLPEAAQATIRVIDGAGKEVMINEVRAQKGLNRLRINTTNYAAGKYVLTIKSGNEVQSISFVKTL